MMAKVLGPDFVALQVRDLDTAWRFYSELLGMEADPRFPPTPDFVAFATQPIPFGIHTSAPGVDLGECGQVGEGVDLWLNCDDADALCASLKAAGVTILKEPEDTPFGRRFVCRDPEGYSLIVYKAILLDQVRP